MGGGTVKSASRIRTVRCKLREGFQTPVFSVRHLPSYDTLQII